MIILYAFYIWGHIPVSNICYALSDQYTPRVYRDSVILAGKILLVFFIAGTVYLVAKSQQKLLNTLLWILFSLALFFSYESMVKISIEYIHFIQYCSLTIIFCYIFPERLTIAVFLALFAGLMDEVYQAYPAEPMNWRDTLLNVTGVIWGILLYWTQQDTVSLKPVNT
ncbi:MAG: hypothetical protein GQ583_00090 [Methyloprofundus sp.]|nr:hypothetical protein [Methyloprofundus sp.]